MVAETFAALLKQNYDEIDIECKSDISIRDYLPSCYTTRVPVILMDVMELIVCLRNNKERQQYIVT